MVAEGPDEQEPSLLVAVAVPKTHLVVEEQAAQTIEQEVVVDLSQTEVLCQ